MIDIKDIQGNVIYSTEINRGAKRKFQLMKEDYITLPFSLEAPVKFGIGCNAEVGGELFEIVDLQKPTYNNNTGGYDYQLRLDAYYWKWKNKIFKFTPETGGQEASWSLTASLDVHLGIFLRNLKSLGYNYRGVDFQFSIDSSVENKAISMVFENTNMIDALSSMAESWGCEWWVSDNTIHFGRCEFGTPIDFKIGENVAEMTSSATQNPYATRLYVFGSEKNLPSNYRPFDEGVVVNGVVQRRLMLPEGTPYIDAYEGMSQEEAIEEVVILDDIYPKYNGVVASVQAYQDSVENEDGTTSTETFYRFNDSGINFSKDYILEGQELKVKFTSGSLNGMEFGIAFNPNDEPEKNDNGSWNPNAQLYEVVANEDYGRKLPDTTLFPQIGDTYILIGWDTAKIEDLGLVSKAEKELLLQGQKILDKRKVDPSTYNCKMFSDYMYEVPFFEVGDKVNLINDTYFENGRQSRIVGYEYNLDYPFDSPVFVVGETASYSRLGALESKLEALTYKGQTYTGVSGGSSSVYIIGTNDTANPTNKNVFSALRTQEDFLSKKKDDRSRGKIASDKGFEVGKDQGIFKDDITSIVTAIVDKLKNVYHIESPEFQMGELGNGYVLKYEDGKSYFEVDEMLVRRIAYFIELIIKQLQYVGGEIALTPASMKCTRVEEYEEYYRCYFEKERDGQSIKQEFRVGDQARAQSFNLEEGVNENVSNQYYWRLVVRAESNENFIDLSKIDCDKGSLPPRVGDDIVQLGNRNDASRQNAIILSTIGDDAPSIKQYEGINSYSLEGKDVTVISPKGNKLKGDFLSKTGQDLVGRLDDLGASLDDVINQTDKVYTIWFENYNPSESNYPTNEWIDQAAKEEHVEDIFYNQEAGMAWRYQEVSEGVYAWVVITDHETIKALENAAKAQATADKKMQNFVAQPVPPYSVGDRWSNAVYGNLYDNDELVCITPKAQGEAFSINDWQLVSSMSSADKKHFYSEFERTDNSIQSLVADGKTKDEAIAAANAAAKAASDAASAAAQTANSANQTATNNATAIDQTNQYLSLVAAAFETNADGSLKLDANGKPILTKAAGAVITADAAGLYAKQSDVTAEFNVRVKFDPKTGKVLSAIKMSADQIDISANDYISIINGGTTTIKSGRLDLIGKVTFSMLDSNAQSTINGKATTGDIDYKITSYDKTLGSLAKLSAVEKAQLGSTIISGGYIKGELLNVTEVHATSGSIAGFKISNNNLTNEGFSSDAAVIFKNNNNIAAIGSNVIPIESGANGAAYFQCHTEDSSRITKNYGMVVSAAGTGENVAIGIDGGCVEGFAMKNRIINGSGTIALSRVDYNVIVTSSSGCVLELPAMRLCDDGHVVRIKRLGSGGVTFKAKQCETFTSGTTGRNYPGIIYGSGKHVGSGNVAEEDKMSQYDSCEFVWVRDLRITIGGTLYNGAWIQYKMPRAW